jgi:hypothetical protein
MTPPANDLARPSFTSVDLAIGLETACDRIEETVAGLAASETDGVVNYRTTDGTLVAVVGPPSERGDAALAYRTAPAALPATRRASRLRDALDAHVVDDADTTEA